MDNNAAKLTVVNKALVKIGARRLTALNDGSPNSVIISDIYAPCLEEILEEHPWTFAVQTVPLTQLALSTPLPSTNDGITYAYGLPADFLDVYLLSQPTFYRIEMLKAPYVSSPTLALLANLPAIAGMKYVFINDDPSTYTAKFIDALACRIAKECCFKIAEAAGMVDKISAMYEKALLSAISVDSNNSSPDKAIADEWFIARLAGNGAVSGLSNGNVGMNADPYNPDFF